MVRAVRVMPIVPHSRQIHAEAAALEYAVMMREQPASHGLRPRDCCHAGQGARLMLRKGVQHRGYEHIACHAAECVYLELHGLWKGFGHGARTCGLTGRFIPGARVIRN